MDLNEMKTTWQQAGAAAQAKDKLAEVIKTRKHLTVVRNVRIKLLTEAVLMTLLLFFFYDIFDGDRKPVYASIALVAGALFYFFSNLLSYFTLQQVAGGRNIKDSLFQLLKSLKQMKLLSLSAMLLFTLTLLLFFTSAIDFNLKKLLLLAAVVVVAVPVQVFIAFRMWNGWINRIEQQLEELEEQG